MHLFNVSKGTNEEDYNAYLARLFPEEFIDTANKENESKMCKTITFQVTDDCCMACTYCYQINKKHNVMSFDVAKKMIDTLLDLDHPFEYVNPDNSPGIIIDFIGGEPFMAIDLIIEIVDYMESELVRLQHPWLFRHRYSICSNGLLYFEPKVQALLGKYHDLISFSISIDGNKELHDACRLDLLGNGTYDRAIAAVHHYVNTFHHSMGSKMTLAPANIMHLKDAVIGLFDSGYTSVHLNCVFEKGWTIEHARIMFEQLIQLSDYIIENELYKDHYLSIFDDNIGAPIAADDVKNWCGGVGNSMLAIDYQGNLYPCLRYMESSLGADQQPIIIGHVDRGIYQTEEDRKFKYELEHCDRRIQSTDECFYCPIASGCAWCSAHNYQEFGTVNKRATYICCMHKARVLAVSYFWNTIYIKEQLPYRFKLFIPEEWALEIVTPEEWELLQQAQNL